MNAEWIDLAEGRDKWRAVVNTVMNIRVHKIWGISCVAEELLAAQEGLCFMELVVV
jgi:hypothetical protein